MKLTSMAFNHGQMVPRKYTCDGANSSPPLSWSDIPAGTQSFSLVSDDPDAPGGDWVHWVLYNIPSETTSLPEGIPADRILSNQSCHGMNDFGRFGYGGPCPPGGIHRYFFKLYALDVKLEQKSGMRKQDLLKAMEKHILAQAELMGKYQRQR